MKTENISILPLLSGIRLVVVLLLFVYLLVLVYFQTSYSFLKFFNVQFVEHNDLLLWFCFVLCAVVQ